MDMNSAVILLSGGQDSTTCLAWALKKFKRIHTISFNYGQRHVAELVAAAQVSDIAGSNSHTEIQLTHLFDQVTKSRLMEKDSDIAEKSEFDDSLPASFVPYRNVFFLTAAAAHAYFLGIGNLVTGICQTDYSGYPDCRNEFAKAMNTALTLASAKPLEIHTPLMWMTKAETVDFMLALNHLDWLAHSMTCYEGTYPPCMTCPACELRIKGFAEAGVVDPLVARATEDGLMDPSRNRG